MTCKINTRLLVPLNSITLTCLISCALALIYLGSQVAFNAIISLYLVALTFTYSLSVGCILWRRVTRGEAGLPQGRWKMSHRVGIAVNAATVAYCVFVFFWSFWPNTTAGGASNFNWAVAIWLAVLILALAMWIVQGRKHYRAPVSAIVDVHDR